MGQAIWQVLIGFHQYMATIPQTGCPQLSFFFGFASKLSLFVRID